MPEGERRRSRLERVKGFDAWANAAERTMLWVKIRWDESLDEFLGSDKPLRLMIADKRLKDI